MGESAARKSLPTRVRQTLFEGSATCQSCGASNVPLELAHVIPRGRRSPNRLDDLAVLCPNCHAILDSFEPRELEFIYFLRDLLIANSAYSDIATDTWIGEGRRNRADLTAVRDTSGKKTTLLIEAKGRSFFRNRQMQEAISQIECYRNAAPFDAAALAFPGRLLRSDRDALENAGIEVWDLDYVATAFAEQIGQLPVSGFTQLYSLAEPSGALHTSQRLLQRLASCSPGRHNWVEYQRLIRDTFEFLFIPPLGKPLWESSDESGTNRRDIIFPNHASEGFWKFLRESYKADFIVVDPKNHKNRIRKPQALQIANYLKPHGVGMFAIITCRKGADAGCMTTLREQWAVYGKLIVLLTDTDLEAMLLASAAAGPAEDVIGQVIQEFRLSM